MLKLSCHCGEVQVTTEKRPDFIHECNCSICSKSGAQWGYFHPSEVAVEGSPGTYRRADKDEPGAQFHFCPNCGSATHFTLTEDAVAKFGNTVMGVNMRLADERDLAGIELRYPDGRGWAGEGEFGYVRAARVIGSG
jgi:hypothetical protein